MQCHQQINKEHVFQHFWIASGLCHACTRVCVFVFAEYCYVAPPADKELPEEAPAILLLHGFGAFGDHWRNNMMQLAAAGYHVYAPTLPG